MTPPAPRDAAQKWIAFGVIVVVAVSVSFASRACKSHLESTLPQPASADPFAQYVPPPPPVTFDETDPPEDLGEAGAPPAAKVTRDAPAGTPDVSLRAKPAWARSPTRSSQAAYLPPAYAPVHSKPNEVFASAAPIQGEGDLERAFVICRGRDLGDVRTRRPLHLRSTLGRTPMFAADGRATSGQVFASAPLVTLRKSDAAEIVLLEYHDEALEQRAHDSTTFEGVLTAATENMSEIECRSLTNEKLADRIALDAGRADAAIARLTTADVNLARRGWGFPNLWVEQAQRTTSDVAALVGWDDPRAKKRVSDLAIAVALFDTKWDRVFAEEHRRAGKQSKVGPLRVTVTSSECEQNGDDDDACLVDLAVKNESTTAFTWSELSGSIARKNGQAFMVSFEDPEPDTIAPAETKTVSFRTSRDVMKGPSLAMICTGGACGGIKLR